MRFERPQLTFKALCALDQAASECHAAPLRRTFAIRFALAYLYTIAEGDRLAFDQFWRAVADPQPGAFSEAEGRYIRATAARTALTALARNVGFPMSPEAWNELSATWRREDSVAVRHAKLDNSGPPC